MKTTKIFGSTSGITLLRDNPSTPSAGLVAFVTSMYNTGHMTGDARRCWLADTGAGVVTGPELVTNGTFDVDTAGWSVAVGAISQSSGKLQITLGSGGGFAGGSTAISVSIGKPYLLTGTFTRGSANGSANFRLGSNVGGSQYGSVTANLDGTYTLAFVAVAATVHVGFVGNGSADGQTHFADNISVREVIADRTYRNRPLSIIGSLTKAPVATGAQLMGFSGFSAVNYGQEPYSSELDFGTGAWTAAAWVNAPVSMAGYPAVGPELVTNGDFSAGAAGWTVGGEWTISGGVATLVATGAFQNLDRALTGIVPGRTYRLTLDVTQNTAGLSGQVQIGGGPLVQIPSGIGAKPLDVVAGSTSSTLRFQQFWNTGTTSIDNISVKEVGATLIDRSAATGPRISIGVNGAGAITATAFDGTTTRTVTSLAAYNNGTGTKVRVDYATTGTLSLRINGDPVASTTGAPLLSMSNVNAVTTVGNNRELNAPFPGSIALVKLGATVPTAEQAQWMYAQELAMFQAGAQVCLPDAGAVVDLAYDDATDRWTSVSATNEAAFTGLVRTRTQSVSAGTYTGVAKQSGGRLTSRATSNPGVDITMPAYALREELVRRSQMSAAQANSLMVFDFDAIAAQVDFPLPLGWTATEVLSAGAARREGPTRDWIRVFDGFRETVRFAVAPGAAVWVSITGRKA